MTTDRSNNVEFIAKHLSTTQICVVERCFIVTANVLLFLFLLLRLIPDLHTLLPRANKSISLKL